jgi:hypothetical protein
MAVGVVIGTALGASVAAAWVRRVSSGNNAEEEEDDDDDNGHETLVPCTGDDIPSVS